MKKLLAIIMMTLTMIGCGNSHETKNKDSNVESTFVVNAKSELLNRLERAFKKGTKAENIEVVYEAQEDSICVIDFVNVYTFASGRTLQGEYEFVYYPKNELGGFFINLEEEKSIIEQSKDWTDELEMNCTPEQRLTLKGWEESLFYVVELRCVKEQVKSFR